MDVGYAVWFGLDVGKTHHFACALNASGERVWGRELPQDVKRPGFSSASITPLC